LCLQQHSHEWYLKTCPYTSLNTKHVCTNCFIWFYPKALAFSSYLLYILENFGSVFIATWKVTYVLNPSSRTFSRSKSWDTAPWMPKLLPQKCEAQHPPTRIFLKFYSRSVVTYCCKVAEWKRCSWDSNRRISFCETQRLRHSRVPKSSLPVTVHTRSLYCSLTNTFIFHVLKCATWSDAAYTLGSRFDSRYRHWCLPTFFCYVLSNDELKPVLKSPAACINIIYRII
jgi:hypothetical protein